MGPDLTSADAQGRLARLSPLIVLACALITRVALWREWRSWPGSEVPVLDAAWHVALAEKIVGGDLAAGDTTWMVAPGLGWLYALAGVVGGPGTGPPSALLLGLDLVFAELCRRLGARLGGPRVGLVAGLTAALSAPLAFQGLTLMGAQAPGVLLGLAVLGALGGSATGGALGGVSLGLSALFRPNHLLLAPLLGLIASLTWSDGERPQVRARPGVALVLGLTLALIPSLARNRVVGGEWVLISANGGANLYMAQEPGSFVLESRPPPGPNNLDAMTRYFVQEASQAAGRPLLPGEADAWWRAAAITRIKDDLSGACRRTAARLYVALSTLSVQDHYAWQAHRRAQPILGALPDPGWLAPGLAALGAVAGWRAGRRREVLVLGGVVLGVALSLAPFGVVERYRVPAWVALYPLAAMGLRHVVQAGPKAGLLALALCFGLSLDPFKNRLLLPDLISFGSTVPWSELDRPREPTEASNVAAAFLRRGDLEHAEAFLRQALALDPRRPDDRIALAGVLITRGSIEEGLAEAETAVREAPRHPGALLTLCSGLVAADRLDEAETICARAAALTPKEPRLNSLRAEIAARRHADSGERGANGISP